MVTKHATNGQAERRTDRQLAVAVPRSPLRASRGKVHSAVEAIEVAGCNSSQLSLFPSVSVFFLSKISHLSHNRLLLYFYCLLFLVPFKTCLVFFSLCARLNWHLVCHFSSANHLSYRIVSYNGHTVSNVK